MWLLGSVSSRILPSITPSDTSANLASIVGVRAQFISNARLHNLGHFDSRSLRVAFDVSLAGDYFKMLFSGQEFARLNKNFCCQTRQLARVNVRFRAHMLKEEWESLLESRSGFSPANATTMFVVDIDVYSFGHQAHQIGDILADAGLFLQNSTYNPEGVFEHNPQVLDIEGVRPNQDIPSARGNDRPTTIVRPEIPVDSGSAERIIEVQDNGYVDSILNSASLSHNSILQESHTDQHRIKAVLLPHQKKAVDFIRQREGDEIPDSLSLWREHKTDDGGRFFRHILTGVKRPEREEARGGIIADEMGLGKTLIVLSAIANTLQYAKETVLDRGMDQLDARGPRASRATLIIAPSTLLIDSWKTEIRTHIFPGGISFHKHLGSERHAETQIKLHFESDVVFTTFATIAQDMKRKHATLASIQYFRIVLDEGELFIQMNLQKLLQTVCLRRTIDVLGFPETVPEQRLVRLSYSERREYDELLRKFKENVQIAVSGHRSKVSATVLHSIHELRLFCNNGLRKVGKADPQSDEELLSICRDYDRNYCAHCHSKIFSIDQSASDSNAAVFIANCKHLICTPCYHQYFASTKICMLCSKGDEPAWPSTDTEQYILAENRNSSPIERLSEEFPSKLQALIQDIRVDMDAKCIVFSSWKRTLDLAAMLLSNTDLRYDFIHGGLALKKRLQVLENFRSATGPNILLMTLGTGAVGLNLAVATRIYILEPQWNPFIEMQAMARAQRLNQTKPVTAIRYIMEDTIEHSNVLNKQKKKTALAGDGFGKDKLHESLVLFIRTGHAHTVDTDGNSAGSTMISINVILRPASPH
ncbi:hypothetical protein FKW77_007440 [Venturia effusa]|uniref:Helicase ATP-binding domain-containing protein n=1 Tax=Venturia effusa TaxID=50376 RepID=A0A517LCN7_9PEZI|nr:hypothetical protein FKW77_007440 [Venturia effusa]